MPWPEISGVFFLGKPLFFLNCLNMGNARKGGGGFNPCPSVFGALYLGALFLGKMPKEGG